MNVIFHRQAGDLVRSREHRAEIDIETEIGIGAGDHFCSAIVAVLAHLGDQDARTAAGVSEKLLSLRNNGVKLTGRLIGLMIALRNHAGHALAGHQIAIKRRFQRIGDFPQRGANAGGLDGGGQQVLMMLRRVSQRFQSRVHRTVIASSADAFQRGDLLVAHLHVINFQYCRFVFFFQLVFVDADDNALALVDERLLAGGGFFDHPLR